MAKVFYDDDVDLQPILDRTVGIIGYGSQGHAHAQNLRDSGVTVLVGEVGGTPNHALAVEHGFTPMSAADASVVAPSRAVGPPVRVEAALKTLIQPMSLPPLSKTQTNRILPPPASSFTRAKLSSSSLTVTALRMTDETANRESRLRARSVPTKEWTNLFAG